jgi:methionyl-tRNA formyltransferase
MRLVYLGSGSFSVPSLEAILSTQHEVAGIVTQPARPAGRGGKLRPTEVAQAARRAGHDVIECADINADESVAALRAMQPDVICVADFGQLIRPAVVEVAARGAVNLHASLLPELRGAAPINWALIRGLRKTGVTTFRIVQKMDAGPIYLQAETDILPDETAESLKRRLARIGAELLCRTLDLLADGRAEPEEQDHARATFAPRLKKSDGAIDWSADAEAVCNLVRGTWPWPGAQAVFRRRGGHDVDVTIAAATVAPGEGAGEPGTLGADLAVSAGTGRVQIGRLRPAGKRPMEWRDFVNGYRVQPGDRFGQVCG